MWYVIAFLIGVFVGMGVMALLVLMGQVYVKEELKIKWEKVKDEEDWPEGTTEGEL